MKLDERDQRILALLGTRVCSVDDVAAGLEDLDAAGLDGRDADVETIAERLDALADNGLVADRGDGRYERTESGRRVLAAAATGAIDERVDTSPAVEEALEGFDLRADEADAVRHAFAFLRYWGRATDEEIADATYSEASAGRETPAEWWDDLVREPLAALPGVAPPDDEDAAGGGGAEDGDAGGGDIGDGDAGDGDAGGGGAWRFAGVPEADDPAADGRRVLSRTHPVYGDVKHALESLALADAEREAARAAFVYLYRRGTADERELREAVYPVHDAGYGSADDWWDGVVADAFAALPGVERADGGTWRYRQP